MEEEMQVKDCAKNTELYHKLLLEWLISLQKVLASRSKPAERRKDLRAHSTIAVHFIQKKGS